MFDDLEPFVAARYLIPSTRRGTAGAAQAADQSLGNGVIVGFYTLDLHLALDPGDRVDTQSSVDFASSQAVTRCMPFSISPNLQRPATLEDLGSFWPTELEGSKPLGGQDLYDCVHPDVLLMTIRAGILALA
jgi:hypothetical protein